MIYTCTISLLSKTCLMHCTAVKLILCLQANSSSGYCPISLGCPISLLDLISSPYHLKYFYYMLNMPSTLAESGHVFISFKLRSSTVDRTLGFRSEDTVVDNLQCRYNAMVESICLFISEPFVSSSLKCFSSQNFRFASAPLMDLLYIFYICSPDKTAPKN